MLIKPKTNTFAKSFPYMILNFLPKRFVKRYLYRKSGAKPDMIQLGAQRTFNKILIIVPDDAERISKLAPFINQLKNEVNPKSLHILCAKEHKDIVRNLNNQIYTLPFQNFKYGDKRFKAITNRLKQDAFDLVLFLENNESFPKLYLSCVSGAKYRVGINCERLTPFLNISLNLKSDTEFNTLLNQLKMHVGI